jgi:phage gpG-like protein
VIVFNDDESDDFEEIDDIFYSFKIKKFGNFKNVLRKWQRYMEDEQRKRIRALAMGGEYDEVKWPYFKQSTIDHGFRRVKGKIKYGDAIMRDSNDIYNSFRGGSFTLKNNSIEYIISNPEYAKYHHFGAPKIKLPQRKLLHISARNIDYLTKLVNAQVTSGSFDRKRKSDV